MFVYAIAVLVCLHFIKWAIYQQPAVGGWVLIWCKFLVESFIMCWSLLLWPYHYNTHITVLISSLQLSNTGLTIIVDSLLTIFFGGERFLYQFEKCSFRYIPLHYVSCYDLHQPLKEWFKNVTYTNVFVSKKLL